MTDMQLAEANIAWMKFPLTDPRMDEFTSALERVNKMADEHRGFVWRLQDEAGAATSFRVLDDDSILFNLSTWSSLEDLFAYTYRSVHGEFFARRKEWFQSPPRASVVMWWVPAGSQPDMDEATHRMKSLWSDGSSPDHFTFKSPFDAEGRPYPSDWRRGLNLESSNAKRLG